ncbi:MAG: glycosyltransferase family 2 protein [Chloroflexota bacterium]|nr:glycosyltransferase family 2 protein [Chloroflexota bacterium]
MRRVVETFSAAALALSGGTLLLNLLCFRRPDGVLPGDPPFISVLVPARNEERNIEACLRSLLAQDYPTFEVVVLDDHSEDRTSEMLQRIAREHPHSRFTIRRGSTLPPDWGGKNWACHQLAGLADSRSRYLLFTDADTVHAPDVLRRVVAEAERDRLALLSLMPEQQVESWGERLVVPLLALQILGYLPLAAVEWLPIPAFAAANGQFMFFRREVYDSFGGHSAYPLGLAEDVILAQRVKVERGRVRLANGATLVRCRMYRNLGEVLAGFRRSFAGGFRFGATISGFMLLFNVVAYWLPFVGLPFSRLARPLSGSIILLRMALAWHTRTPKLAVLAHPVGMTMLLWAQLLAVYDAFIGGETRWKGRRYGYRTGIYRKEG